MSNTIKVLGRSFYITPTGVKLGSKGKVLPTSELIRTLVKSQRRQVRKALRAAGHVRHAAM